MIRHGYSLLSLLSLAFALWILYVVIEAAARLNIWPL
jgi:hypothetical protein